MVCRKERCAPQVILGIGNGQVRIEFGTTLWDSFFPLYELGTESNQDPSFIGMFVWNPSFPCSRISCIPSHCRGHIINVRLDFGSAWSSMLAMGTPSSPAPYQHFHRVVHFSSLGTAAGMMGSSSGAPLSFLG